MAEIAACAATETKTEAGSAPAPEPAAVAPLEEENRRLRVQYSEIAQLAGGLAHEIRNPLSTMALNLDLLAEDFTNADSPRERRVVQKIDRLRRESQRLQDILESFLRFARVQDLKCEPVDLNVLVEDVRDFFEPQAVAHGIVIRAHLEPDLPCVSLDADLFRQALLNLFMNARQAMPDGGELFVRTRSEGAFDVLDVTDTGVGMTPDVRARVFDAFYSTRPGGSGLGLPTTRKIVEAHAGSIRVESEPGKGSQFSIRLPNVRRPGP
jgi:signal transduction histidine kinase